MTPEAVEGGGVPLSEEEQRILHEMEQSLYETDRAFVNRVSAEGSRSIARRSARWAVAVFVAGFLILLLSFRSSLLLGTFGFIVMLLAALAFEHSARHAASGTAKGTSRRSAGSAVSDRFASLAGRLRDRPKRRRQR